MEQFRRQKVQDLELQITRLKKAQQRDADVITNLPQLGFSRDSIQEKKQKMESSINKRLDEINSIHDTIIKVKKGEYDNLVHKNIPVSPEVIKNKKVDLHLYSNRAYDNEERHQKNDYDFFYRQYCSIVETLPEYMRQNLLEMPQNKGYIWKRCHFYGLLPVRNNNEPLVMFEKGKKNILLIHEYDSGEHRIYEKIGKDPKRLLSRKPRRQIVQSQMYF
jgi:hypothetical protein